MSAVARAGRRVVAFTDHDGRSKFWPQTDAPAVINFQSVPGLQASLLWATNEPTTLERGVVPDPVRHLASLHPEPGGTTFMTVTIPPDSVSESASFDPAAAAAEQLRHLPGIADRMEPDAPGFHATDTVDYAVVLSGKIVLAVDDEEVTLDAGDSVIQLGGRHAWRNPGDEPATLIFILLGASR